MTKNEKGFRDVTIVLLLTSLIMLGTYTLKLYKSNLFYQDAFTKLITAYANCEHQKEMLNERIRQLEGY